MKVEKYKFIGNVKILNIKKQDVLDAIQFRLTQKIKTRIFFINAHCYNIAQKNSVYLQNVNNAEIVLNDGIGIELGAKLFDINLKENLNGTDFTPEVLKIASKLGQKVYLLGGKPGVAKKAGDNIQSKYPGIIVVGCNDGYFEDSVTIINEINLLKPDLLLVGMGVPIQENWISLHMNHLNVSIAMAVGAFLDFTAGKVTRAPIIFRKLRIEWIFRLLMEPKRMWKRYIVGNVVFFFYILKYAKWRKEEKDF